MVVRTPRASLSYAGGWRDPGSGKALGCGLLPANEPTEGVQPSAAPPPGSCQLPAATHVEATGHRLPAYHAQLSSAAAAAAAAFSYAGGGALSRAADPAAASAYRKHPPPPHTAHARRRAPHSLALVAIAQLHGLVDAGGRAGGHGGAEGALVGGHLAGAADDCAGRQAVGRGRWPSHGRGPRVALGPGCWGHRVAG